MACCPPSFFTRIVAHALPQNTRLVHHSQVHWHLRVLDFAHYLYRHRVRCEREFGKVHPVSCAIEGHRIRLLCQFRALLRQSVQSAVRIHCRYLLHFQASRHVRNHFDVGRRRFFQSLDASLHGVVLAHIVPFVLSQRLCDTSWHGDKAKLRVDVQEQQEEHIGRERAVAGRPRRDSLHTTLRRQDETGLWLFARQV